jgi:hypothetical protein
MLKYFYVPKMKFFVLFKKWTGIKLWNNFAAGN